MLSLQELRAFSAAFDRRELSGDRPIHTDDLLQVILVVVEDKKQRNASLLEARE